MFFLFYIFFLSAEFFIVIHHVSIKYNLIINQYTFLLTQLTAYSVDLIYKQLSKLIKLYTS